MPISISQAITQVRRKIRDNVPEHERTLDEPDRRFSTRHTDKVIIDAISSAQNLEVLAHSDNYSKEQSYTIKPGQRVYDLPPGFMTALSFFMGGVEIDVVSAGQRPSLTDEEATQYGYVIELISYHQFRLSKEPTEYKTLRLTYVESFANYTLSSHYLMVEPPFDQLVIYRAALEILRENNGRGDTLNKVEEGYMQAKEEYSRYGNRKQEQLRLMGPLEREGTISKMRSKVGSL